MFVLLIPIELFHAERKENDSRPPTNEEAISKSEVTLGKRPASHGESPSTKRIKLLAVFRKFSSVVEEIGEAMSSVNYKQLLLWMGYQEASKEPRIHLYSKEYLASLDGCEDASVFLKRLSFQWSWIDHSLLEDLVRVSRCEEAAKLLEGFKAELAQVQFLSSFTVPSPCTKMLPIDEKSSTIMTLTVECKLFECTLRYISELKSSFTIFCGLIRHSVQLVAVKQTSLTTTIFYWMISRQLVPLVFSKVQTNCPQLRSSGILEVAVYPNIVVATDGEVRYGSLSFLTISGGVVSMVIK